MTNWKEQLKTVYNQLQLKARATKPKDKFDTVQNYKGRAGYNDVGIPMTARAAKNKMKNRSTYAARARAKYYAAGSQLRNINERRKLEARERWGLKEFKEAPSETTKHEYPIQYNKTYSDTVNLGIPKNYSYYDPIRFDDSVEVTPAPDAVTPVFKNKVEEEIYRLKRKR